MRSRSREIDENGGLCSSSKPFSLNEHNKFYDQKFM